VRSPAVEALGGGGRPMMGGGEEVRRGGGGTALTTGGERVGPVDRGGGRSHIMPEEGGATSQGGR
jgi:hypothetical protein